MNGIDLIDFNYSMKDIPFCNRKFYTTKILDQTAKFINRMRWRAFFFENHDSNEVPTR